MNAQQLDSLFQPLRSGGRGGAAPGGHRGGQGHTPSASREDELLCRQTGVDAFLAKPVDHDVLLDVIGTQLSLSWLSGPAPREPRLPEGDEGAGLVIPPAREIEALWQLVRIGNMRVIMDRADYLEALDPTYAPFANACRCRPKASIRKPCWPSWRTTGRLIGPDAGPGQLRTGS